MATRQPYDQERIVRHSEVQDEPTAVVRQVRTQRTRPAYNAYEEDAVVVERPVATTYAQTGYDAEAIREDVTIDHVVERRALLDRVSSIIWFVTGVLMTMLALRIVFLLLEASRESGFVRFIYGFTEPWVRPFQGIFATPAADGAILDSAAITAMVIYALLTWGLVRLIWLLFDRAETGTRRSVSQIHSDRV
jgi:uncharacterized protein YggT (Ycf19 family)